MSRPVVVTVDGPAASGKTSVSRDLANRAGWKWVSTGIFYRGLTFVALKEKTSLSDPKALAALATSDVWSVEMSSDETYLMHRGRRIPYTEVSAEEVGMHASQISQYPEVRKALLAAQRACASLDYTLVAEGRDCGSVVFPEAALKIYLTASSDSRAMRRAVEKSEDFQELKTLQKQRDQQDKQRAVAPMQVPEGGHVVDSSSMSIEQVVTAIESLARSNDLKTS